MSAPIIITVPNYLTVENGEKVVIDAISPTPSRKRRLDHLSWEEKMQRKKLKNRVAAQTSRDRKKAKMDDMESCLNHFKVMNEKLTKEVASLKALNERLMSENASLRSEAAARSVVGAQGPAEGGPLGGGPRGAPSAGDVSSVADILAHLDSEEYLDTLNQLADTLLKEIDASAAAETKNVSVGEIRECSKGTEMVGTTAEHMESSKGSVVDIKHDVNRILLQHSYAHPYPDIINEPDVTVQIKEESENDKGDLFFESVDEANDCITVEVPSDDAVIEEKDMKPIEIETDFNSLTDICSDISLESNMKLLSPIGLSPKPSDEINLLGVSPSHTCFSSDLGYESLASPLSEAESIDLPDFWCESFSELFPGLA